MSEALASVFEKMKERFKPGVVERELTFYFSLGEAEGQKWTLKIGPESRTVEQGKVEGADVFLKVSEELFLKMLRGDWKPGAMDFMTGKIKSNDPFKLSLLQKCFT